MSAAPRPTPGPHPAALTHFTTFHKTRFTTSRALQWIAKELADADEVGAVTRRGEILARYTYRMHSLSEFMKALLHRFSVWFNRTHQRTGTLWEERYKSVIVEDGIAAKTMAAYIDLNCPRSAHAKRRGCASSGTPFLMAA